MPSSSPDIIINEVKRLVESDKRSEIRLNANGGNSILVVCPPDSEPEYIQAMENQMEDGYEIIKLDDLLMNFVESNRQEIEDRFDLLRGSVEQVFKLPQGEDGQDLYKIIMDSIVNSFQANKIPVLVNTGSLYGSGIENIHIMENEQVMKSPYPLIILYPAVRDHDRLMFLGIRPASKYRCMIME
ncbi:MAG: hypothetical protein KKA81_02010 [Bacteroidetes bacterium]|nr:hypothetical protein [Bacteroidota bacterium]